MSSKKKKLLIALGAVVLVVGIGTGVFLKSGMYTTLVYSYKYSSDELSTKLEETDKQLNEDIKNYFSEGIREYTPEEQQALETGEVTEKELLAKIITEQYTEQQSEQSQTEEKKTDSSAGSETAAKADSKPQSPPKQTAESITSKYVAKMYSLEGTYMSRLNGLLSSAKAEYLALPNDKRGTSAKLSIGAKYMGKAQSLEGSCDSEVAALLSQMEAELKAIGADTSITSTLRSAYASEKNIKRAYYMSLAKQ